MDGTRDSHSKISQKEKDKCYMISLISGMYYIAQMNISTEKKIVDLENRLVAAQGGGEGGSERDWEPGVNRCKLLLLDGFTMRSCYVAAENCENYV